jgi:hypothetical protein
VGQRYGGRAGAWLQRPAVRRARAAIDAVRAEHPVPFRLEAVTTPFIDFLLSRADVDPARIALYGISQAGYWVPRTLAFEHRIAAAIADPGVVDVSTSWTDHMPKSMIKLLHDGDSEKFDKEMAFGMRLPGAGKNAWSFRARPYNRTGYFDTMVEVLKYNVTDVAGSITTPLLITSPEDEQFWPGQSETRLARTGRNGTGQVHRRRGCELPRPTAGPAADRAAHVRLA